MVLKLKEGWRRFADLHLTRPRRIFIDLVLAAVLAFLAWQWYGYPLPLGGESDFRRLEQKNLLGEGELVLTYEKLPGKTESARITRDVYADLGEDRVVLGYLDSRGDFDSWAAVEPQPDPDTGDLPQKAYRSVHIPGKWLELYPRTEGVQVIPISVPVPDENGNLGWAILVTGYPESTMYGRLEITGEACRPLEHILDTGNEKSLLFWQEAGILTPTQTDDRDDRDLYWEGLTPPWGAGAPYRLELMDAEGMLDSSRPLAPFLVQEGVLPDRL